MSKTQAPPFFIRHKHAWEHAWEHEGENVLDRLWNEDRIAVCFDGKRSWEPSDYKEKGGPSAIRYLNAMNEHPHTVVAQFDGRQTMRIGRSVPGTKDFWAGHLKTIRLTDIRDFKIAEFSHPFLLAPPHATLVRWPAGARAVRCFYEEGHDLPVDRADSYLPWQLEVLAEEWLRRRGYLVRKYLPTGGSMKTFDIVGEGPTSGLVLAQVKHHAKPAQLEGFARDVSQQADVRAFFIVGQASGVEQERLGEATLVTLQQMLEDFATSADRPYLRRLLSGRLGMGDPQER